MVSTEDWLPIGSVVYVRGIEDPVMVIGYLGQDGGTGNTWDDFGRKYPAGWSSDAKDIMFDRDAVEGVLYVGYQDERFATLVDRLEVATSEGADGEGRQ